MQGYKPGAIYNSDLRQQELEKERRSAKLMGLARMAVATAAIVSSAAYWQNQIEEWALGPSASTTTATAKATKVAPTSLVLEGKVEYAPPVSRVAQASVDSNSTQVPSPPNPKSPPNPEPRGLGVHINVDDAFQTNTGLRDHIARSISKEFKISVHTAKQIVAAAAQASEKYNVEVSKQLGLIEKESSFRLNAVSPVGAVGLTQVREKYHPEVLKKVGVRGELIKADARKQVHAGIAVLDSYRKEGEPLRNALVAYNVGPNAKDKSRGIVYANLVEQKAAKWRQEAVTFLQEQAHKPQIESTTPNL
jgi:soluble lytic murein transglycosylase-like protein